MTSILSAVRVYLGDITQLEVDAIVNAANTTLMGGGGVDGAIHRAAGPSLLQECKMLGGCRTGEAKITGGHMLPAKFVIHAVGPVYNRNSKQCSVLLANCYRRSLSLAEDNDCVSIAFPCISTGVYRYPKKEASSIAFGVVKDWLKTHAKPKKIIFACFSKEDADYYNNLLKEYG